jgi:hypothetical protein
LPGKQYLRDGGAPEGCPAVRRKTMINKAMLGAAAVVAGVAQAGAKYAEKLGSLFAVTLQRLYDAHMEKAQMRFAPTPILSGRLPERQHFIGR